MEISRKKGLVVKSTGSWYVVETEEGVRLDCRMKGKFRLQNLKTTNPVAVGDRVGIEVEEDGNAMITELEDRTNYIIRRSVNLSKQSHILASNIDQSLLVITIKDPETQFGFVDRYLAAAESFRIPVILIFNKMDIYGDRELKSLEEWIGMYSAIGYNHLCISAQANQGMDAMKNLLKDKVSLISGNSGVGKSTLINSIVPDFKLRTADISKSYHMGKHTTTNVEMHKLPFGGYIIDTPGIKSFGLYDLEKQHIAHYFPEMRALLGACKYPNCVHINEPNCAVKTAVEAGHITGSRYFSYLDMVGGKDSTMYRRS